MRLTDAGGAFALRPDDGALEPTSHLFFSLAQLAILVPGSGGGEFYTGRRAEPNGRNGESCTTHPRPVPQRARFHVGQSVRIAQPKLFASKRCSIINIDGQGLAGSTRASTYASRSFETRTHPSNYTATIQSLVVKQRPKFRRLGPPRRLGVAIHILHVATCRRPLHGKLETMDSHRCGGVEIRWIAGWPAQNGSAAEQISLTYVIPHGAHLGG
jgi:hypothetical protein